jgi:hypothetical protein
MTNFILFFSLSLCLFSGMFKNRRSIFQRHHVCVVFLAASFIFTEYFYEHITMFDKHLAVRNFLPMNTWNAKEKKTFFPSNLLFLSFIASFSETFLFLFCQLLNKMKLTINLHLHSGLYIYLSVWHEYFYLCEIRYSY